MYKRYKTAPLNIGKHYIMRKLGKTTTEDCLNTLVNERKTTFFNSKTSRHCSATNLEPRALRLSQDLMQWYNKSSFPSVPFVRINYSTYIYTLQQPFTYYRIFNNVHTLDVTI